MVLDRFYSSSISLSFYGPSFSFWRVLSFVVFAAEDGIGLSKSIFFNCNSEI